MTGYLVFLYDSSIEPWHDVDVEAILARLRRLEAQGVECEVLDTKDKPDEEFERWRKEARVVSSWRGQQIRVPFGSRSEGMQPDFGRHVPALLVYDKKGDIVPRAVYPHSKKRDQTRTDFSIEGYLEQRLKP